jgi:cystathionine gamma-synthase
LGSRGFETLCVHGNNALRDAYGAIATPIYQTATFAHHQLPVNDSTDASLARSTGFDYSRGENPTREQLEWRIADLEGADIGVALSSGMAAISALFALLKPGDQVVASGDLYGGTNRLFNQLLARNGVQFYYATSTEGIIQAIERARASAADRLRFVFVETPTNPMMQVFDIAALSDAAHAAGALLAVDNTFLTPCFQRPLSLGADIVVHSGSKYLGGHNDTIAGLLAIRAPGIEVSLDENGYLRRSSLNDSERLPEQLRFMQLSTGAALAPFDSFLLLRGIKTLPLRMERAQQSALRIARFLESHPRVRSVLYTGLPSHPDHALSLRQASGFGATLSFYLADKSSVSPLFERIRIIQFAESLGGTESLLTYPLTQTHADVPPEQRDALGISECLVRLSVGVESCDDLLADLEQALA